MDYKTLNRFSVGDVKAFNIIYDTYYQQLVYFGYTLTNDQPQSEDAATEAFVNLWNARNTFKNNAHLKNYLFLSVRHSCLDFLRSAKTHTSIHHQLRYLAPETEDSLEQAMAESEIIREIAVQIKELPPQCAKVFSYIFFDGMNTEEVALAMHISAKNVLNQKGIAIKLIRLSLLKKGLLTLLLLLAEFFFNFLEKVPAVRIY